MQQDRMAPNTREDFVTIIAATMAEVMQSFKSQGLAEQEYTIVHRGGEHSFTVVDRGDSAPLFGGEKMIAATFARRISA